MTDAPYFRLLGEFEVTRRGGPLPVPAGRLRVLLATLLLRANQTVPVEALIDRLWDGAVPRRARGSLPTYVMRLRRVLGDDTRAPTLIHTRPGGYLIEVGIDQVDLLRFRDLVERAAGLDPAGAAAALREALALWRGPALAGIASEPLRRDELPHLVEERLGVLERRIELDLQLGQGDGLVGELSALIREHPLRERFWGQLMRALSGAGRQAEALERYREIRGLLIAELGIEPGPELQRLHEAILRGEPHAVRSPLQTVPRQLPADIASFTGRVAAMDTLDGQLTASTVVISAIHGTAGVGKTALAVRWSHRMSHHFPDGQLYLNLRGFDPDRPPIDPGDALGRFLQSLGVEQTQIPHDIEERSALFRSTVAGKRMLVVLDNAATAEQVRPLLPGTASCLVLVTSRNLLTGLVAVDDARSIILDVLDPAESLALLENVLGRARVEAERDAAAELARLCGNLPLALRVAAGKLVMRPRQPLAAAVDELGGGRLDALEVDGDRRAAVRAAFDMSYLALKPEEQRLFRRLALIPGPHFTPPACAALVDLPESDAFDLLDRLVAVHLVDNAVPGRYRLHDLLRLYARSRCGADESTVDTLAAAHRLFEWYLATARVAVHRVHPHSTLLYDPPEGPDRFADSAQAWSWLEAERPNLTAAVEDADPPMVVRLVDALRGFFIGRAYLGGDWRNLTRIGLRAAERLGDDRALAAMHLNTAVAHFGVSNLRGYLDAATTALDLARRAGWVAGTAKALTYVGQGRHELGEPSEALGVLMEARDLTIRLGARADLSYVLLILAHTQHELGNLTESLELFGETLAIGRELDSLPDVTLALYGLGMVHTQLGHLAEASASYAEGLTLSRELGNPDRLASNLGGLAQLAQLSGRAGEARELLREALALAATASYRHTEVDVRILAGRIHAGLGEADVAAAHYEHALRLARKVGYRFYQADALLGLAAVRHRLGDHSDARALAERALAIARDAGYQLVAARARTMLAELTDDRK